MIFTEQMNRSEQRERSESCECATDLFSCKGSTALGMKATWLNRWRGEFVGRVPLHSGPLPQGEISPNLVRASRPVTRNAFGRFSLSSRRRREERVGERRASIVRCPSLRLSPRSCLSERERTSALEPLVTGQGVCARRRLVSLEHVRIEARFHVLLTKRRMSTTYHLTFVAPEVAILFARERAGAMGTDCFQFRSTLVRSARLPFRSLFPSLPPVQPAHSRTTTS